MSTTKRVTPGREGYKAVPTYEGGKLAVAVIKPPKVEEYTAKLSDAA